MSLRSERGRRRSEVREGSEETRAGVQWLSVRPETEVMFWKAKQAVEKVRGERLDEDAVLAALCRSYLSGVRTSRVTTSSPCGTENDLLPRGTENDSLPRGTENDSLPRGSESDSWEPGANDGAAPYRVAVTVCSECNRGCRRCFRRHRRVEARSDTTTNASSTHCRRRAAPSPQLGSNDKVPTDRTSNSVGPASNRAGLTSG
jgi:hypothetical protein